MRRRVEKDLRKHTAKLTRVPAVDKARVLACLEKGSCTKDHRAKVLGSDYLNKEGYLYWQLHRKSIFTPGELGCTLSHLKAIEQASGAPPPNPNPSPKPSNSPSLNPDPKPNSKPYP